MAYDRTGSGNVRRRELDARALVRDGVVGARVLQLGDGAEIAGLDLRHRRLRLSLQLNQVAESFRRALGRILTVESDFRRALIDAEHRDAAGKLIGDRLPHEGGIGALVVGGAHDFGRRRRRVRGTGARPARASRRRWHRAAAATRIFASPDVQTSGNTFAALRRALRPASSSSCVSVPASKNFSISCSSASATISMRASRAAVAASASSAGTAPSVIFPELSPANVYAFIVTRSTTPLKSRSSPIGS